jgi:hypothetical protein
MSRPLACAALLLVACTRSPSAAPDADLTDAAIDKSAPCVGTFGGDLVNGFGRLDGTVLAIVPPGNTTCPFPNSTHVVLEVQQAGKAYRMVATVKSSSGNPVMAFAERDAPLAGPAWEEGWHLGVALDYVTTLGLHRADFAATELPALVDAVSAELELGARISVYATVEDQPDSAHLIHRNATDADGAIVTHADTTPHYLLFRFDNQLF